MSWKFTRRRLRNGLDGKDLRVEKEVRVERVEAYKTNSGNTRFVLRETRATSTPRLKPFQEEVAKDFRRDGEE
jgi:hypothetical protein